MKCSIWHIKYPLVSFSHDEKSIIQFAELNWFSFGKNKLQCKRDYIVSVVSFLKVSCDIAGEKRVL